MKLILTALLRIADAKKCVPARGTQLKAEELYGLLQLPTVYDMIMEYELNRVWPSADADAYAVQDVTTERALSKYAEQEWYPPICYMPLTGPAPDTSFLNRCGLNDHGCTSFKCCSNCWCLKSSAGTALSLRCCCVKP